MQGKTFFIDLTKCTACRGCQVACKQWKKLPAEETRNWGSHQNPKDLSYNTLKLVRFTEVVEDGKLKNWLFFPEQCRHCVNPPCKMVADNYDPRAILQDPLTGAVI
ncbi:MAG TPA: formate dehydrogenase, partial [Desulfonatronum sp.]|nr:formate dehydrogenase [Desulfonatronum sp.]HDQ41267.1 formate dehydrogenase [Desulfonatronum sp.]